MQRSGVRPSSSPPRLKNRSNRKIERFFHKYQWISAWVNNDQCTKVCLWVNQYCHNRYWLKPWRCDPILLPTFEFPGRYSNSPAPSQKALLCGHASLECDRGRSDTKYRLSVLDNIDRLCTFQRLIVGVTGTAQAWPYKLSFYPLPSKHPGDASKSHRFHARR